MTSQYPFNPRVPTRTVVLRGKYRKPRRTNTAPPTGEMLRQEVTPPIQTDEERGQGDSTNARLHRILHPQERNG
jgi:hypothetical protein